MREPIEDLSKDDIIGVTRKIARQNDPVSVGKQIVFYLSANRPQEDSGLNLKASAVDPSMKHDLRFAFDVARDIVPEYESVRQEGELDDNSEATFYLER